MKERVGLVLVAPVGQSYTNGCMVYRDRIQVNRRVGICATDGAVGR